MKIYFSDFFGVSQATIEDHGAFDISLVNDLPLFVDPFLLFGSEDPVYRELHDDIIRYMRFLRDMSLAGSIDPALITAWFSFPEVKQNWFGFSKTGNRGHGLGADFAKSLYRNLHTVSKDFGSEVITRGSHLEKLCLIKDGVGRDNISDFATNLIKDFLCRYTEKFAKEHIASNLCRAFVVDKAVFNYDTRRWESREYTLPALDGDFVLLTPRAILTKDDTWINRPELLAKFDQVAASLPDAVLRAQVDEYLLRVLPKDPEPPRKEIREAFSRVLDKFPEVVDYYIRDKEDDTEGALAQSQKRVAETEVLFVRQVRALVGDLLEPEGFYALRQTTYEEALSRVRFFKDVIENKGGHRAFYLDGKPIERESDLHIMFRLTWFGTESDVSAEVNDGRGPADYKISRGARDKTIIEFKLAKNTQLKRNLQNQTAIYEAASDATNPSIKVIVFFDENQLEKVRKILGELEMSDDPNIVLIDARADNKPSGSKA